MKKFVMAATAALFVTMMSRGAIAQDAGHSYVANTAPPDAFLALKRFPGNGPRIMAMANGTKLDVLFRRADGWWYVKVWPTGEEGWAFSGKGNKAYILCCTNGESAAAAAPESAEVEIRTFSCQQLWFGRNSVFKEAGYCFKTQRAISTFGNAGCQYDNINDVPLSPDNQAFVSAIKRAEQMKGCSP